MHGTMDRLADRMGGPADGMAGGVHAGDDRVAGVMRRGFDVLAHLVPGNRRRGGRGGQGEPQGEKGGKQDRPGLTRPSAGRAERSLVGRNV